MEWQNLAWGRLPDSAVGGLIVLAVGSLAARLCRQPVRRARLIVMTFVGGMAVPCLQVRSGYPGAGDWRQALKSVLEGHYARSTPRTTGAPLPSCLEPVRRLDLGGRDRRRLGSSPRRGRATRGPDARKGGEERARHREDSGRPEA